MSDALVRGLQIGLGGAGLAAAPFLGPFGLLAGGIGGELLGGALAGMGTSARMLGPSDEDIARAEQAARSAQSQQIARQEARATRGAASRAAQGGTLESGLAARDFGDIATQAGLARGELEASLARQRLAAVSQRYFVPQMNALGLFGRLLATSASPLTALGAARLVGGPGALFGHGTPGEYQLGATSGEGGMLDEYARFYGIPGPALGPGQGGGFGTQFSPFGALSPGLSAARQGFSALSPGRLAFGGEF